MKKIFSKEVTIGLCVILALAILIFGIDYLKGAKVFGASNYYYVNFNNVEGLAEAASVNLNGFKVGQVSKISYDYEHPGNVIVELGFDKEMKIPQGSTAVLYTDLLGTASIRLELGKSTTYCNIGDYIEGKTESGMLDAVSEQLLPDIGSIAEKADSLLGNLNTLVSNEHIANSLENIDNITSDLNKLTGQVNTLVASLNPIVQNVRSITNNVDTLTGNVNALAADLGNLPIDKLVADLQGTVENLKSMSEQLNNPNSSLGQLMNSREMYDNINATISSLDSLFVDIKRNPKRYVSIKVF